MFNVLPLDNQCQIMQYLQLGDLMQARRASKQWQELPVRLCFKPDRLSAIPLNLLYVLTKKRALSQMTLASPGCSCFAGEHWNARVEQFNLKHFASITSSTWDWSDAQAYNDIRYCCIVLCRTITEVIFYSDRFPLLVQKKRISDIFNMFPSSTVWKCVFQGPTLPCPDIASELLLSTHSNLKELIFSNKDTCYRIDEENRNLDGNVLFTRNMNLRVLKIPQFKLTHFRTAASAMLYYEDAAIVLARRHRDHAFYIRHKSFPRKRICALCHFSHSSRNKVAVFICAKCSHLA